MTDEKQTHDELQDEPFADSFVDADPEFVRRYESGELGPVDSENLYAPPLADCQMPTSAPTLAAIQCKLCGAPLRPVDRFCRRCGRENPGYLTPDAMRRWLYETAVFANSVARKAYSGCAFQIVGFLILFLSVFSEQLGLPTGAMALLGSIGFLLLLIVPGIVAIRWSLPGEVEILRRMGYGKRDQRIIWWTLGFAYQRYEKELNQRYKDAGYKPGVFFCNLKQFNEPPLNNRAKEPHEDDQKSD